MTSFSCLLYLEESLFPQLLKAHKLHQTHMDCFPQFDNNCLVVIIFQCIKSINDRNMIQMQQTPFGNCALLIFNLLNLKRF